MGLFDRFKKVRIEVSSKMMEEEQFWNLIHETKKLTNDLDHFADHLTAQLEQLTPKEVIGFYLREQKLRFDSYNSELWCAGYIMNGGCSDDCFEYFRCWIISQGKEIFYLALNQPDSLVNQYTSEIELYDFEDLMYVASNAFENKTGKEIEDFIDYDLFKSNEANYPSFDFNWEEENVESMKKICPELMKIAWN